MKTRGFSLLEVLMAMAILSVGAVGALGGVISANQSLREGQLRVLKQALIDASLNRARLYNKAKMYDAAQPVVSASAMPDQRAMGLSPWVMDPTPATAGDLSTGALFVVLPDGTLGPCTSTTIPACIGITSCADSALPLNVFCRETVLTRTASTWAPGGITPAGTLATTQWVRVVQKKRTAADTADAAVMGREVFAQ